MAKNTQPVLKRCKTLGLSPAVLGYSKSTKRQPKQSRRKQSEYGMQLNEKQKVKFIYGVLEKQFHATTRRLSASRASPVRSCCRSSSAVWTT